MGRRESQNNCRAGEKEKSAKFTEKLENEREKMKGVDFGGRIPCDGKKKQVENEESVQEDEQSTYKVNLYNSDPRKQKKSLQRFGA